MNEEGRQENNIKEETSGSVIPASSSSGKFTTSQGESFPFFLKNILEF
jgi:hypothetical protein